MSRQLSWDACVNVRDLGGLAAARGTTTRSGVVVRSDTVRGLTASGWAALTAYGVKTLVDLRSLDEVRADRHLRDGSDWLADDMEPPATRPERPVPSVNVPLLGTWTRELEDHFDRVAAAEDDPDARMRAVYVEILALFSANVVAALEAVVEATTRGAVVVHCQAGKDRTGLVCALLLLLSGVEPDAVADDYAQSGANIAEHHDVWVDQADDEEERERRRRIGLAPRQGMIEVLETLEARWGGAEGYLRTAGLGDDALARLRTMLVPA